MPVRGQHARHGVLMYSCQCEGQTMYMVRPVVFSHFQEYIMSPYQQCTFSSEQGISSSANTPYTTKNMHNSASKSQSRPSRTRPARLVLHCPSQVHHKCAQC